MGEDAQGALANRLTWASLFLLSEDKGFHEQRRIKGGSESNICETCAFATYAGVVFVVVGLFVWFLPFTLYFTEK